MYIASPVKFLDVLIHFQAHSLSFKWSLPVAKRLVSDLWQPICGGGRWGLKPLPPRFNSSYPRPIFPPYPAPFFPYFFRVPPPKIQIHPNPHPAHLTPAPAHFSSKAPLPPSPYPRAPVPCPPPPKTRQRTHDLKILMVHSGNKESDTENLETQYHTRAMKGTRNDFRI